MIVIIWSASAILWTISAAALWITGDNQLDTIQGNTCFMIAVASMIMVHVND